MQCDQFLPSLELRMDKAIEHGLLIKSGRHLRLTDPKGMAISNQIFVEILLWWESLPNSAVSLPRFGVP